MYAGAENRVALESDLSVALESGQLFIVYQPIVEIATRRMAGVEALLRWRHPRRGVILPEEFIPIAEDTGLIAPIGRWVLERACLQAAEWAREGHPIGLAVNVSAQQLGRRGLTDDVKRALGESGIDPSLLTLEITESTLTVDVSAASEHLQMLKHLGVKVAIDDFGTGYASLSQLQRMPVDILKVDKSFVAALGSDERSHCLLEAIVGVGRALSLRVIAEGVERDSQLSVLREMGCEMAQGHLLGEPGGPQPVTDALADQRERRAVGSRS
jgi:EAL domain-containing protein (putative c-di-GMP-specific phosphodiesterase class I)